MKRKVLLIYYQNIKSGGVAKVISNLANELVAKGVEVEILFLMAEHEDFYPLDHRIKKHYVDSFNYWTFRLCKFNKDYLRFIPKLNNINAYIYQLGVTLLMNSWLAKNHHNYNCIISCWYKLSCALAVNKKINHKTIAWEHTSHKVGGVFWDKLKPYYKNLKSVVCLNQDDYGYFKKINPQTFVIGNMMGAEIDSQAYISSDSKENLISMIARLDEDKNVLEFLEIIKKANLPNDWTVNIIGAGPQRAMLEDYITTHNLINITMLGQLDSDEVQKIIRKSKISCLTSVREGFGVVLVEAMFCSNALIAYDCPSGPAEIVNNENGFLVPLRDKDEFVNKLKYLVENPSYLDQLMATSFADSKKWNKAQIVKQWIQLF